MQIEWMSFADWSETEIHDLRWAARQGRSLEDIAQHLGRSTADLERKACALGIALPTPDAPSADDLSDRA